VQETLSLPELPDYAKDLKLNLSSLFRTGGTPGLSAAQRDGVALAAAAAARNPAFAERVERLVAPRVGEAVVRAAKAAAALMGMNNVYYRFLHLVEDPEYARLPAKLRMNVLRDPGVERSDFELFSLAVSAINGCGACVQAHEQALRQAGLGREAVQSAVRIAAVVHAAAASAELAEAQRARVAAAG